MQHPTSHHLIITRLAMVTTQIIAQLHKIRWVLLIGLLFGVLQIGCLPKTLTEPLQQTDTNQIVQPEKKKAKASDKKKQAKKDDPTKATDSAEKQPTTTFNAKEVSSYYQRAKRVLSKNYSGFLKQTPLGFNKDTPTLVFLDIQKIPRKISAAIKAIEQAPTLDFLLLLLPLVISVLFVAMLGLGDRHFYQWTMRWQARQYPYFLPDRLINITRSALWIAGSVLPVLFLVALSYFPIKAIFGPVVWTTLLTQTLWLIVMIRTIIAVSHVLFGLFFKYLEAEDAQTLNQTIARFAKIAMFLLMPWLAFTAFDYHKEVIAFCAFAVEFTLALLLLLLFWRKNQSIVALFPKNEEAGPLYKLLLGTFETQFHLILLTTSSLLIMMAFGYQKASSFLLFRGYGVFLLIVGSLWLMAILRKYLYAKQEAAKQNRAQSDLLRSIRRLMMAAAILTLIVLLLQMFALYEPIVIVLKSPLLTVQNIKFSIFNIISAATIVGTATLISLLIRLTLNAQIYPTFNVDIGVAYAINTIINYLIIVVGFFLVLVALGVNLAALTVVLASLSVGIGFGLQTLTENLISGLILLFGRAVQKGDYVTVNNIYGRVEAVGARSVVVRTMDNYDMLIPSKELVNGSIINWSYRDPYVRLHIPVGVTYKADPKEVERVLLDAASRHEDVLKLPEPQVWFTGFGDNSINFSLLVYFDCNVIIPDQLKGQIYFHIWDALADANIEIPYPQRDLHLRSVKFTDDDMQTLRRLSQLRHPSQHREDDHKKATPPGQSSQQRSPERADPED